MVDIMRKIFGGIKPKGRKPINLTFGDEYVKSEYPEFEQSSVNMVQLNKFVPLKQNDYKGELNCSLTSITACVYYLSGMKYSPDEIYCYVMKVAKWFLYTPRLWGTFSFTIGPIYAITLRHFGVKRRIRSRLIKGIGFNAETIISRINSNTPVMINMFRDGRGYYHNHTVTVTGYRIYNKNGKRRVFLVLNDNWTKEQTLLDYRKLWIISSVVLA